MAKKRPTWKDSDAPDAEGRMKKLSCSALADWMIKSRKGETQLLLDSLDQHIVSNRPRSTSYPKRMECATNKAANKLKK